MMNEISRTVTIGLAGQALAQMRPAMVVSNKKNDHHNDENG
jgi:hypothetical protein